MDQSIESILGIQPESRETGEPVAAHEKSVWSFQGRIGRGSFWARWLLLTFSGFAVGIITGLLAREAGESLAPLVFVIYMAWLVPAMWLGLAMQVKRWHDLNYSGLAVLWNFTIIAMPVTFIMLAFVPGTSGPNKYGNDPLRTHSVYAP